jgi:carbon-monoxide dehydrogenase small subunit
VQGRRVTTIEAIAADPGSATVRDALSRAGAVQCGYCNPGIVVAMTFLHRRMPRPDVLEATALMSGNLCRCTGYGGVSRAITELFGLDLPH